MEPSDPEAQIVARSAQMRRTLALARAVAHSEVALALRGEAGSGKELVARLVHQVSPRSRGPFVAVRCDALPDPVLAAELFGDPLAGAREVPRPGALESAAGGVVYLDEVCALPLGQQRRLLATLYERELRRDDRPPRPIDVRLIITSDRDLDREVTAGRLHPDMRTALGMVELVVPPLRERKDDILPLARAALVSAAARLGRDAPGMTPRAARRLQRHGWPGNVRELNNAMERALLLCEGPRIDLVDLPIEIGGTPEGAEPAASDRLDDVEREHILRVLARSRSKAEAADRLGIGTATLFRKLRQYGHGG